MKPEFKIEVGKFYRTRYGHKVRIYALDGYDLGALNVIHGAILDPWGWSLSWWTLSGQSTAIRQPESDIIGPWIEAVTMDWSVLPKWAKWIAKDHRVLKGLWCWYSDKPSQRTVSYDLMTEGLSGEIPPEFAPKWDGDWTESLTEVPNR